MLDHPFATCIIQLLQVLLELSRYYTLPYGVYRFDPKRLHFCEATDFARLILPLISSPASVISESPHFREATDFARPLHFSQPAISQHSSPALSFAISSRSTSPVQYQRIMPSFTLGLVTSV